jgi:glycosyltransferase involved in cell wall biosynthesis
MSQPKITVIIPTRNRPDTLVKSLATVVAQDYENLTILVSDNFSCDSTEDVVQGFQDDRIQYVNTGHRISMSHNWEFALSHVSEGWVTILGDDDGLLPSSLNQVSNLIQESQAKAIRSSVCSYLWPALNGGSGRLGVPLTSGYEIRDTRKWLFKLMSGYAQYPELPMLYNGGFVEFEVLEKIRKLTGSFYLSCIPDVYSAISISSVLDEYVYSHTPFAINGGSIHSTGTSHFSGGTPNAKNSPKERFKSEGNIPFHCAMPLCDGDNYPNSLEALVYESYLQSSVLRPEDKNIHEEQLSIILATVDRKHEESMIKWGRLFSDLHGLNFDLILNNSNRKKTLINIHRKKSILSRTIRTYSVGAANFPINDVYEASLVAGSIRQVSPSVFHNIGRLTKKAWRTFLG